MPSWVVEFECDEGRPEAAVVDNATEEEARMVCDGLGCKAMRVRPLSEVRLRDVWMKNGVLRCALAEEVD
jgi:hypothetical protein